MMGFWLYVLVPMSDGFFVVVFFLNGDHNFTAIYSEDGEVKSGLRTIAMELHKGCITEPHFQDLI